MSNIIFVWFKKQFQTHKHVLRLLQSELRCGQLECVDQTTDQGSHPDPRTQSCSANRRRYKFGRVGIFGTHGGFPVVRLSGRRK